MALYFQAESLSGPIEVTPKDGKAFSLEELQHYVGGYVEIIRAKPWHHKDLQDKYIVCDEDGLFKGLQTNLDLAMMFDLGLVGDVLICEQNEIV